MQHRLGNLTFYCGLLSCDFRGQYRGSSAQALKYKNLLLILFERFVTLTKITGRSHKVISSLGFGTTKVRFPRYIMQLKVHYSEPTS
jgi:hypothetical protein